MDVISENWRTLGLSIGNYYAILGYLLAYFYAGQCIASTVLQRNSVKTSQIKKVTNNKSELPVFSAL